MSSIAVMALTASITGAAAHNDNGSNGNNNSHISLHSSSQRRVSSGPVARLLPARRLALPPIKFAGTRRTLNISFLRSFAKNAAPIVLTHTAIPGIVWRTTPDGREGWAEYFVRQGYPVFVMDPPGVGRAGLDIDAINAAATGRSEPLNCVSACAQR